MLQENLVPIASSFRDPSGRLYEGASGLYRSVAQNAETDTLKLISAPWFLELVHQRKMISSTPVQDERLWITHPRIHCITYSWEWTFSQLKAAALLTLDLELNARKHGYSLKDATSTNILFDGNNPVLVDIHSFERLIPTTPWTALGQFCRAFLFPLMIFAHRGINPQVYLERGLGEISLADTWQLLGRRRAIFKTGVFKWVYLQLLLEGIANRKNVAPLSEESRKTDLSQHMTKLIRNLRATVEHLTLPTAKTEWSDYKENNSYSTIQEHDKIQFIQNAIAQSKITRVIDLGANSGTYSLAAAELVDQVISLDIDHGALSRLYQFSKPNITLIQANIASPTPRRGWNLLERQSLTERLGKGFFLSLALIHHLRITNGIPLDEIIAYLAGFGCGGVIEWVDKDDPMTRQLLRYRKDVFFDYHKDAFKSLLNKHFDVLGHIKSGDHRELYWVRNSYS